VAYLTNKERRGDDERARLKIGRKRRGDRQKEREES